MHRVPRGWRVEETDQTSIHVPAGQRPRALKFIDTWLERIYADKLLIVDPYFGTEDAGLILCVHKIRQDTQVAVLTGSRGDGKANPRKFKEDFKRAWRALSREPIPEIEITIVRKTDGSQVLHQRYLIGEWEGMEIGCGWKDLGRTEAKLTRFDEYALEELRSNLKGYLITTQAKRNLSSRSGIGGVLSAT